MCQLDPNVEPLFVKTINEFVEQGRAFTGYDLTLRTREREGIRIRHQDCRQGIHEMQTIIDLVEFDDWHKELHDLGNGQQALLYYPNGYDTSTYQPVTTQAFQPSISSVVSPSVSTASVSFGSPLGGDDDDDDYDDADDAGGEQSDGSFRTDYRGRLLVPTRFLKEAGVEAKDSVTVLMNSDHIVLAKTTSLVVSGTGTNTVAGTQVVERNGDLRLSKKTLTAAGLVGNSHKIENKDGNVVVTKA